ncbi:MAG: polysaccharide biosynthesis/export family protein [Gemmatimonadota bacterium]
MLALVPLVGTAAPVAGQDASEVWNAAELQLTRTQLEALLERYEETARSSAYSGGLRDRARRQAELIRNRLTEGDFRVGDRIVMTVEGESQLSDTFTVSTGRVIRVPVIGELSLDGVLRAELEESLTEQLGRYIQDPSVHAEALIRLGILGAVGEPGFYTVPADVLLSDAIMLAGGLGEETELTRLRIMRGDDEIWGGDRLQEAMTEGRTLDQLNLRAGDRIVLPPQAERNWWQTARLVGMALSALTFVATQIF